MSEQTSSLISIQYIAKRSLYGQLITQVLTPKFTTTKKNYTQKQYTEKSMEENMHQTFKSLSLNQQVLVHLLELLV